MIKEYTKYNGRYQPLLSIESIKDLFVEIKHYDVSDAYEYFHLFITGAESYQCMLTTEFRKYLNDNFVVDAIPREMYLRVENGKLTLNYQTIVGMYTITALDIKDIEEIYDECNNSY